VGHYKDTVKVLHDGQAILTGTEYFTLADFPKLRVIGCNMTSIEHLPLSEAKAKGIKIISLKGETEFLQDITSTAEHTIGLMIALLRCYKTALNAPYGDREEYKGYTLSGKTLGIIGHGRIGKQVTNIVMFGVEVIHTSKESGMRIGELLKRSDIVTLHIPLEDNEGFFTRKMFKQMKPTAYFINTSRDKIVERGALQWALENKKIAGAAVDFIDDSELVMYANTHDNLILTNHQGGNTFEDQEKTERFIEDKINIFMQHGYKHV